MSKKLIVGLTIFLLIVVMVTDFRVNGVKVFENFARQLETESLRNMQHGGLKNDFNGPSADIEINNKTVTIQDENIDTVFIRNPLGTVDISGEDRNDIELSYKITVYAKNLELAESLVEELSIIIDNNNNNIVFGLVDVKIPEGVYGIKIDYNLLVPENMKLDIENKYGRLEVSDMTADVSLRNVYDEMDINNISGKADLYARYGNLYVKDVEELELVSGYNAIDISNVHGNADIEQDYGQGRINLINGDVVINSSYGSLYFDGIKGDIKLKSKYTQVRGEEFDGNLTANIRYGQLRLSGVSNDLDVDGRYTAIEVNLDENLKDYKLYCETDYADINTNLSFDIEKDNSTKIMEGTKGTGEVKINLISDHSEISIYK